jgi:membrane protein required for beta-lactamase induction
LGCHSPHLVQLFGQKHPAPYQRIRNWDSKTRKFSKSNRDLIIYGLQAVFVVIAILCIMFVLQTLLFVGLLDYLTSGLPVVLLWLIPALVCIGVIITLRHVHDWPAAVEKIDKRIPKLEEKFRETGANISVEIFESSLKPVP